MPKEARLEKFKILSLTCLYSMNYTESQCAGVISCVFAVSLLRRLLSRGWKARAHHFLSVAAAWMVQTGKKAAEQPSWKKCETDTGTR